MAFLTFKSDIEEIIRLLWGGNVKDEIFRRWKQGFNFSDDERTALIQHEGGPCAVIVPVQAYLLREILFNSDDPADWKNTTDEKRDSHLVCALHEIFQQLNSSSDKYIVVSTQGSGDTDNMSNENENSGQCSTSKEEECENQRSKCENQHSKCENQHSSPKKKCFSHEEFHEHLMCHECQSQNELKEVLEKQPFTQANGILLFLYSIILTKGIEQIKNEMEDPSEALIDPVHGHGSQSLINLLLTGRAVSHVFDNDKDISGLRLQGIQKRSQIGFLTYLEHLRYLEVGWYLKNPEYPIWLLGSETHLTLLFTLDQKLVLSESPEAEAIRVFTDFDNEGSGFVSGDRLGELMSALNLVSDDEYVKIIREKLDPEQLGIVTLNSFMQEFFPPDGQSDTFSEFELFHYNGLPRSCPQGKVKYLEGRAQLKDYLEVQFISDTSQIKHCLATKWPTVELYWRDEITPSLN